MALRYTPCERLHVTVSVALERLTSRSCQGNVLVHIPKGANMPIAWISDFGLSVDGPQATTQVTYSHYRAPELPVGEEDFRPRSTIDSSEIQAFEEERIHRVHQLEKADVYSFGITALYVR